MARPAREAPLEEGVRIRLFDADRNDKLLSFEEALASQPTKRQLLWIDVARELGSERDEMLTKRFGLSPATRRSRYDATNDPHVALYGSSFHIRLVAEPDAARPEHRNWLDIVAAPNVVISRHEKPLAFLEAMDERIADDATIGEMGATEFVASLLDAVVTTYLAAVDAIEDDVDRLDAEALRRTELDDLFEDLVAVRRRVSRLRRVLADHRELFAALGRRDFAAATNAPDPEAFQSVASRFEGALASVEETREVVLGSFDVLMTRTAQRTNDVMRVLTVATVLALPATVITALLGMNVEPPLGTTDPLAFWLIVLAVVAIEAVMLAVARRKHWL